MHHQFGFLNHSKRTQLESLHRLRWLFRLVFCWLCPWARRIPLFRCVNVNDEGEGEMKLEMLRKVVPLFYFFIFFERSRFMKLPQKVGFGDLEIWIFFWGKVTVRLIKGVWDWQGFVQMVRVELWPHRTENRESSGIKHGLKIRPPKNGSTFQEFGALSDIFFEKIISC